MHLSRIAVATAIAAALAIIPAAARALPVEVVVQSPSARLCIGLDNARALLKSITNVATGEVVTIAPESADFELVTDKGTWTRSDFTVKDVISRGDVTFVVMESDNAAVTWRYEVWPSGCVKRCLEICAKTPLFVEKVALLDAKINEPPSQSLYHNARFLRYDKGGLMLTVEMPEPARNVRLSSENALRTTYEPVRSLAHGEILTTVPAVFCAWSGDMQRGFDTHRRFTCEQSGWRGYATVRTSSACEPALTTAYDGYKAIDDDPATRWRSETNLGGTHWIEIEFPKPVTFDTMTMLVDNQNYRPVLDKPAQMERCRLQVWENNAWRDVAVVDTAPAEPVRFGETTAGKVRLLIEGCHGSFSLWDFRLYSDPGTPYVAPENVCSKFWVEEGVRMPFTYFNTWYIRHPQTGRLYRARGLLTYDTVLPLIPLAARCGMENFVLDSGWKYQWYGKGTNPNWETEFYDGVKPFTEAADKAGITLAGWFYCFWLEGEARDHQWRVLKEDGASVRHMCLLSGYYDFAKREMLDQIRNSHMLTMKIDGFVPWDYCYATDHNHKPGNVRDASWLAFMKLAEELKRQYPRYRLGIYTWDPFWLKYSEIVHTYQDHGGLTAGELAPTRAKMNYMHDREMFNEGYWRYLVQNQIEGSTIITERAPEWKEELIGNLAGPTRRQISACLTEFTADEIKWIGQCVEWSRDNARFLEQIRPFFPNPAVKEPWGLERNRGMEKGLGVDVLECNTLEGYAHIDRDEGYVFVFNPTFHGAEFAIPISTELGFSSAASGLNAQVIYPYLKDLTESPAQYGSVVKGFLPAEKYIVVRVSKTRTPTLAAGCEFTAQETIWDNANLCLRATPTQTGGVFNARLVLPDSAALDSLIANGKPVKPEPDGSYTIPLKVPVRVSLNSTAKPSAAKDGRKTVVANVVVRGDLEQPRLMLFLLRKFEPNKDRLPKPQPGELDFRLFINGKPIEGQLGQTLEHDWETNQEAGWWMFDIPQKMRSYTVTIECSDKVSPVLVYSAKQITGEVAIVANYSRTKAGKLLTIADPEPFFHEAFPTEREYFAIVEPQSE